MRVLVACEFSGIVREAFRKKGHDAWSCDLLPTEIPGQHIQHDVLDVIYQNEREINFKGVPHSFDLMIAHPPCTHLAVSGARWFKQKQKEQKDAIEFFMKLINVPIERICVENPISIMSTKYRKPEQIIQPWQFGHGETKATCLWLKNLPQLKQTKIVSGREGRVWKEPPSKERWKKRSITYIGIADAMAEQWGSL
jgi:site-specific DNA-cytosine methylase